MFLYVLVLVHFNFAFSQDYKAIDAYLMNTSFKEVQEDGMYESLNILFTTNDCDSCIPYLYGFLKNVDISRLYAINIITDNVVYARKALGVSDELGCKFYYNKEVFEEYLSGRSGIYYKDGNDKVYDGSKEIKIKMKNASERKEFFNSIQDKEHVLLQDSLLSGMPFVSTTMLPNDQLLIFDNKMDIALVATLNNSQNSISVTKHHYETPDVADLEKIFNLPGIEGKGLTYSENLNHLEKYYIKMVKVYSIVFSKNQYYITFGLTRANKVAGQIKFSETYFVGTQRGEGLSVKGILDISAYETYYMLDHFVFDGQEYKIIGNIRDKPHVVSENKLSWKVRIPNDKARSVDYGGLAVIKVEDGFGSIWSLNDEFDEFLDFNPIFEFKGKMYFLFKKITSPAENKGDLLLKEFNSQFVNKHRNSVEVL